MDEINLEDTECKDRYPKGTVAVKLPLSAFPIDCPCGCGGQILASFRGRMTVNPETGIPHFYCRKGK